MLWLSVCRVGPSTNTYSFLSRTKRMHLHPSILFCQYPKGNVSISRPPTPHSRYVLRVAEWDDHIRPACIDYLARKPNCRRKHVKSCGKSSCLSSVLALCLIVVVSITELFSGFHFRFVDCLRQLRTGAAGNTPEDICHRQDSRMLSGAEMITSGPVALGCAP